MKKVITLASLIVMIILMNVVPAFAAETVVLSINGDKLATAKYTYSAERGDEEGKYYVDVLPQVKKGTTYVPIGIIAKFIGAQTEWRSPMATITYGDKKIVLLMDKSEATVNDTTIQIEASPYLDKGRVMVPLRFISETLELGVEYINGQVDISVPTLRIQDNEIKSIQKEYWMTMGSEVQENDNNLVINRSYKLILDARGSEVTEPTHYGTQYMMDEEKSYTLLQAYTFVDQKNKGIAQYEVYYELSYGMKTGVYVIRDVKQSKWYSFSQEAYNQLSDLGSIGTWKTLSNTIV